MGYAQRQHRLWTPQEYLELERKAEFRSEYFDGEIYPMGEWQRDPKSGQFKMMAGASPNHNSISANAVIALGTRLRGESCRPWSQDMRVKDPTGTSYFYPDVLVACPPFEWHDNLKDTLLNPVVLIEILSPSTALTDQNEKWNSYRHIASLRHYLVVAQDRVWVRHFARQSETVWLTEDFTSLQNSIRLESLDCTLPLLELYEDVEF